MGFEKTKRPILAPEGLRFGTVEELGSTSGDLNARGISIVTATATGLVYQLQAPSAGLRKTVVIDYTGATGNLTIANESTATVFNGTTGNVITVSSSDTTLVIDLIGLSTARWAAISSTGSGISFAGSTVTS